MNKKVVLISGLVVLLGAFVVYEKFIATQQPTTEVLNTKQTQTTGDTTPTPQPTNTTTANYKDGIYTGKETSSIYGKAKAEVVIVNGKIKDVLFPEFPNDRVPSTTKSNMAMPIIKQEVIAAQNANVNTVSGATETSASFIKSIADALRQAQS